MRRFDLHADAAGTSSNQPVQSPFPTVDAGNYSISYLAAGSAGPCIVLVHAAVTSPGQWRPLFQAAAETGAEFHFRAPALIGYADSRRRDGTIPKASDDLPALLAFMDSMAPDEPVHLVGHSYGGATALKAALERPSSVRSLALFEPVLFDVLAQVGEQRLFAGVDALAEDQIARIAADDMDGAARGLITYWRGRDAWAAMTDTQQAYIIACMPTVAGGWQILCHDRTNLLALSRLACPVTLLSGGKTTAAARAVVNILCSRIPQAVHHCISEADHMGPVTHSERVNPIILNALRDGGNVYGAAH